MKFSRRPRLALLANLLVLAGILGVLTTGMLTHKLPQAHAAAAPIGAKIGSRPRTTAIM